jgi:diaminopimelate decarboxylase
MHHFQYVNNELYCEDVPIARLSEEFDTPLFVYSRATLERHFKVFREPFLSVNHLVCFSVKACSNIAILRAFRNLGGGMDIVSGGELYRSLKAGADPAKIVYSGVGKKASEMDEALNADILMFNIESEEELRLLNQRAHLMERKARIALRVNPDVDPRTHPYISTGLKKNKFGIDTEGSVRIYRMAKDMPWIEPVGVDCHIGSQLTDISPFLEAIDRLKQLIATLRSDGIDIRYLDIGGGLGIPYDDEEPPRPEDYGAAIIDKIADLDVTLIMEPGRVLVGNAGVLVTKVLYLKQGEEKTFVIADAGMNDLIRPSLYQAHHTVLRASKEAPYDSPSKAIVADLVGPICESGDFLAQEREMEAVKAGDLLVLLSAGAYGFTMSSNYNSRPRAAEILVDRDRFTVIRERESYEDLTRGERIPESMLLSS